MEDDTLNPLTLGDTPEEYIENEDGSVDIVEETEEIDNSEFYTNLAESLESSELNQIGGNLVELIEKDKTSREKRDKQYEEGIRRTGLGDDAPGGAQFDGASRVVHPVLAEACVDFASSAIKELFPASGPVRTEYIGDISRKQKERGDRKKELMNWQMTKQMPEYYDELEQLLSQMPLGGSQYLKLRYDESMRRPVAEFIPIDEIFVPYAATNFYTASRATHRQLLTQDQFEKRVESGFYRDISVFSSQDTPEQSASALANDKVEGAEDSAYNEDGLRAVLEVYTFQSIEDSLVPEGETAPYVIHIDEHTEQILAIYRNWDDQDETREKLDWIVEFKFIPWRGAYALGLPHLIGGLATALTGALRALMDTAHINNAPSMLKLKTGRVVGQNTQVDITGVTEIDAPANITDIRQIAMPMPFNPPSPVLFQLLGFLTDAAKGVVSTAEEKIAEAGNQMPVGTAMALIEQGSKVFSAIHARLHRSQGKVLEILARINSKWLDENEQQVKLGKVIATREDFTGSLDIIPASDPNIFSESQRFAQMQALLQMAQDPRVQWQINEIYHRMLDLMHVSQPEKLLPKIPEPLTSSVMEENNAVGQGKPVKAEEMQDHLAHINGHLAFVSSPIMLNNPLVNPAIIQGMLGHINEHMTMLLSATCRALKAHLTQQAAAQGVPAQEEQIEAEATAQAGQIVSQQLQGQMQQIGQVQQALQSRMPPPQLPPEVQASIQIAQMETQRRTQMDQATLGLKQAEQQASQQMESQKLQMQAAQQQFDQMMENQRQQFEQYAENLRIQAEARNESMRQELEMLRNAQDNHAHQVTELLKNRDDNQTQVLIEQMKQQLGDMQSTMETGNAAQSSPDMSPMLRELQMTLDQMSKQQTNDTLVEVMNGLRATVEHLGKPKMLIKDQTGKTVGIQTV